jgi:hypothetical protein
LLVIKTNVGHNSNAAIPCMRCVKAATKSNLDDCRLHRFGAQGFKDCSDKELKLGRWPNVSFNCVGGAEGAVDCACERQWGEWAPIEHDALSIANKMRLRRRRVAEAMCAKRCGDKRDNAPLPVRSSNKCSANVTLWRAKLGEERDRALEAESNTETATCGECLERGLPCACGITIAHAGGEPHAGIGDVAASGIHHSWGDWCFRHGESVAVGALLVRESPHEVAATFGE